MVQGEELLFKISKNYKNLFKKFANFEGTFFRPWGTTHSPGSGSILLYLSLPLSFLINFSSLKSKKVRVFLIVSIGIIVLLSWFTIFISQIRSALIKHILIVFVYSFIYFVVSKNRVSLVIRASVFLVFIGAFTLVNPKLFQGLENSLILQIPLIVYQNLQILVLPIIEVVFIKH